MITEDYVSFETAKLLKEKGFDANITTYRDDFIQHGNIVIPLQECLSKDKIKTPTLQMAMKWLREEHGLNVQPCIVRTIELKKAYNATIYSDTCEQLKACFGRNIFDGFKSYEEACEAAIKYCLTNLI